MPISLHLVKILDSTLDNAITSARLFKTASPALDLTLVSDALHSGGYKAVNRVALLKLILVYLP